MGDNSPESVVGNAEQGPKVLRFPFTTLNDNEIRPSLTFNFYEYQYKYRKNPSAQTVVAAAAAGGITGAAAGAFTGVGALISGLVGAAAGGIAGAVSTNDNPIVELKNLKSSVILPVPTAIQTNYGAIWDDKSLGSFVGAIMTSSDGAGFAKNIGAAGSANLTWNLADSLGADGVVNATSLQTGLAINPFNELLYGSPQFREFNMEFTLVPRNEKETREIQGIVDQFRTRMHPEFAGTTVFLKYPDMVQVIFSPNEIEQYFFRIDRAAITNCSVTFNEQSPLFMQGTRAPSSVKLTLTLREMEMLVRENSEGSPRYSGTRAF